MRPNSSAQRASRGARFFAVLGLLALFAVALSGCVHLDRSVALNSDGSGTYVLKMGVSQQLMSLSGEQIRTSFNQYGEQIKAKGGSYTSYDEAGYTIWAYTKPFKTVEELNAAMKDVPQVSTPSTAGLGGTGTGGTGTGALPTGSSDSIVVTQQPGLLTNSFHVVGNMSMKVPDSLTNTSTVDVSQYLKDLRESFAVTMPGWVTSHKGGTVSGNTVTYTIHYGDETAIDVVGGGLNTTMVALLGGGAVLALLLIASVVAFVVVRRRAAARAAREQGAPVAVGVPAYPSSPDYPPTPDASGAYQPPTEG